MHRIADARVLLADKRPHAALREARGHEESSWATAHDEDIRRPIHEASIISGLSGDAAVALFPSAGPGDPEGKEDQLHVEPETGPPQIDLIQPELARSRDVARCIDLRQPRQAGPDAMTRLVARNLIQSNEPPVAAHFDFTGSKRTRADEAHVAGEDIPQLRQFVHCRRAHEAADARDAGIVLRRLYRARARLGIGNHRSKLQRIERPSLEADARLPKEHRPAILQLDDRGEQRPDGRRYEQADARERE